MNVPGTTGATGVSIDRDTSTIRFERRFDAAPSDVFDAWTIAEQVTCWWDPAGEPLVRCEIDLRVGGSFAFASSSHPDVPFAGVYSEIVPGERLVFEAMGATGRVSLRDSAGRTHMLVEITCRSAEHLDQFVKMGVHAGTARTLDNLVVFVDERGAPAR